MALNFAPTVDNVKPLAVDFPHPPAQRGILTGTAPDMSTVLNFRKAWEDMNNMAQVDNTQFVSGIGYRFDLRVRWK